MTISVIVEDARWRRAFPRPVAWVKEACTAALRNRHCEPKAKQSSAAAYSAKDGLLRYARNDENLSILLTNDASLRTLNHDFRGKDKPTNVLSFPQGDDYLGDIALAYETICREAEEQGKSVASHTAHMVVHGVLHLLGHDHEAVAEAERMEALEIRILKGLSVPNPYRMLTK